MDSESGITHQYEYDSLGHLIRAWQKKTSTGETLFAVENTYDKYGRAKGSTVVVDGNKDQQSVHYKKASESDLNLVSSVYWSYGIIVTGFTYQHVSI